MWIIIVTETHYESGDRYGRDNYPGRTQISVPWVFIEESLFLKKIEQLDRQNAVYCAYAATKLTVTRKISYDVSRN